MWSCSIWKCLVCIGSNFPFIIFSPRILQINISHQYVTSFTDRWSLDRHLFNWKSLRLTLYRGNLNSVYCKYTMSSCLMSKHVLSMINVSEQHLAAVVLRHLNNIALNSYSQRGHNNKLQLINHKLWIILVYSISGIWYRDNFTFHSMSSRSYSAVS